MHQIGTAEFYVELVKFICTKRHFLFSPQRLHCNTFCLAQSLGSSLATQTQRRQATVLWKQSRNYFTSPYPFDRRNGGGSLLFFSFKKLTRIKRSWPRHWAALHPSLTSAIHFSEPSFPHLQGKPSPPPNLPPIVLWRLVVTHCALVFRVRRATNGSNRVSHSDLALPALR